MKKEQTENAIIEIQSSVEPLPDDSTAIKLQKIIVATPDKEFVKILAQFLSNTVSTGLFR